MKEKDFEMIVPAYDALEAELEEILGGGGDDGICVIHCTKCQPNNPNPEPDCFPLGSATLLDEFTKCCSGATPLVYEDSNLGKVVICVEA